MLPNRRVIIRLLTFLLLFTFGMLAGYELCKHSRPTVITDKCSPSITINCFASEYPAESLSREVVDCLEGTYPDLNKQTREVLCAR